MGWSIGYDSDWKRDIGYGVPAYCDHPGCTEEIDRGLSYVCCKEKPYGGDEGCGLFFCRTHRGVEGKCARCSKGKKPFDAKPDHPTWIRHQLTDPSWAQWRSKSPKKVERMRAALAAHDSPTADAPRSHDE